MRQGKAKSSSPLLFILKGLLPYSKQNMMLAFSPGKFFRELEKAHPSMRWNEATLKTTYYRAKKAGYFEVTDSGVVLTKKAMQKLKPFQPKLLKGSRLLVSFDIPESKRAARSTFRSALYECRFKQVQRSVWISSYDSREYLRGVIKELNLEDCVIMYEVLETTPNEPSKH